MRIPGLLEELYRLEGHDYWNVGLMGNPAYSELRRGEDIDVSIAREALEKKIKDSITGFFSAQDDSQRPRHLYLFSREGGVGKSHTQRQIRRYCRENGVPFAQMEHEDFHEGNIPENLPYMMKLIKTDKIVVFLECDHPWELYDQLCSVEGAFIIGSGHEPNRELRTVKGKFEVLDLERDYPLSSEQLLEMLRETMKKLIRDDAQIVGDDVLEEISKNCHSPGDALNVLGVCLALYTHRAKIGEKFEITVTDARQWSYKNMFRD